MVSLSIARPVTTIAILIQADTEADVPRAIANISDADVQRCRAMKNLTHEVIIRIGDVERSLSFDDFEAQYR